MKREEKIITTSITMTGGECDAVSLETYLSQHHVVLHTHVEEETPRKGCFGWIRCCVPKRLKRWWKRRSRRQHNTETVCGAQCQAEDSGSAPAQLTTAQDGQTEGAEAVLEGSKGKNTDVQQNTCTATTSRHTGFTSPVIVGVVWKNKCTSSEGKKQDAGVGLPLTECASTAVTEHFQDTLHAPTNNKTNKRRRRNRRRKHKTQQVTLKCVTEEEQQTIAAEVPTVNTEVPTVITEVPTVNAEVPTVNAEVPTVNAEVPTVNTEVPTVNAEVPTVITEVPTVNAEAGASPLIQMKSDTRDQGTNHTKETNKRRRRHRSKNNKCEVTLKSVTGEEAHLGEEITSVTVEDLPVTEHIHSSTEALPSVSQEITTFISEEVMPVSEEVLCAIVGGNVASSEEEVCKCDQDKLTIEKESEPSIQDSIPVNSESYTSDQEAAIVNQVLLNTNKDVVQEEIVPIDVRKKVVKSMKNNGTNDDSHSDDDINVIVPSVEEQRQIGKSVLCVAALRAAFEQWRNVPQGHLNENLHNTDEARSVNEATTLHCDGQKNKMNKLKKVMKRRSPANTTHNQHQDSKPDSHSDDINVEEQRQIGKSVLCVAALRAAFEQWRNVPQGQVNNENLHNTDGARSVNEATTLHCDGQKNKKNKLKKVMKRRTPATTTHNQHRDSKPANNEADHDSDSDDDINIILPSIAEQRKFAEGASHIANLQKFQKVLDKVGLVDVMKKYYVLNYRDVWARAAGGQYQGVVGRGNSRWNWRGRGQGWNRGRGRERGTGRGLEMPPGHGMFRGRGRGLEMSRGRGTEIARGRGTGMTRGKGHRRGRWCG